MPVGERPSSDRGAAVAVAPAGSLADEVGDGGVSLVPRARSQQLLAESRRAKQFYATTTDRLTGAFTLAEINRPLPVPELNKHEEGFVMTYITLPALGKTIRERTVSCVIPLLTEDVVREHVRVLHGGTSEEIEAQHREHMARLLALPEAEREKQTKAWFAELRDALHRDFYAFLGPEGLAYWRVGLQRSLAHAMLNGTATITEKEVIFDIDLMDALDVLYERPRDRNRHSVRAVQSFVDFLKLAASGRLWVRTQTVNLKPRRGGRVEEVVTTAQGAPISLLTLVTQTRRVRRKADATAEERPTLEGAYARVAISATTLPLFVHPRGHGTFRDETWFTRLRAQTLPWAVLMADYVDTQFGVGWGQHGGTMRRSFRSILRELHLLERWESLDRRRRSEFMGKWLDNLRALASDKIERGLYASMTLTVTPRDAGVPDPAPIDMRTLSSGNRPPLASRGGDPLEWLITVVAGGEHLVVKRLGDPDGTAAIAPPAP